MDLNDAMETLNGYIRKFIRPDQVLYEVAAQTLDEYNQAILTNDSNVDLQSLAYQIHALRLLIEKPGSQPRHIRRRLSHMSYNDQHQILTRWAWMRFHYENLTQKHKSKRPFQCNLGEFHQWITEDYEYYVLLNFLPHFSSESNIEFLFEGKPEQLHFAPDFLVKHKRKTMGIEITIAPEHETFGRNQYYRSRFISHLHKTYQSHPIEISLMDVNRWHACIEEKQHICLAIDLWLILNKCNQLAQQSLTIDQTLITINPIKGGTILTVENQAKDANITFEIQPANGFILNEADIVKEQTHLDETYQVDQCCKSIISRINAKNTAQFGPNTILVIWPMNQFNAIDYGDIAKKLRKMKIKTHFKEVWIFTKTNSHKIK
ncbi:hypothetical protein DID73_00525 [Candidatus Marinamargulisbacteria bacterium SCGC AG-343-K17]|nr:hypothetical protein DID73_00525 [Candidatus Marinamargulisbacteria bacterium SCGC AG-343-K17]